MIVTSRDKEIEVVEVGSVNWGDHFLFDDNLCVFVKDDLNLRSYDGNREVAVFDLVKQVVYVLPFNQRVVVVDVDNIRYSVR